MDAELTPDVIKQVRDACEVRDHHLAQLRELGALAPEDHDAAARVDAHLGSERPWREIVSLAPDLDRLRATYVAERRRLLAWQNQQCEQARAVIKARAGFSTLTADQAHKVLRPIAEAMADTSSEAVAPRLTALSDPFLVVLHRAEAEANERLDAILSEGDRPLIRRLDLELRNRELAREEDIAALLDEIDKRLRAALAGGARVRLV